MLGEFIKHQIRELERRDYDYWYDNPSVCRALDWFLARGKKA